MTETQTKKYVKRCKHGKNWGRSCNEGCSRYKLIFLLKSGSNQYKITGAQGKLVNPVLWCFLKMNKRPINQVFAEMLTRLKNHSYWSAVYQASNKVRIYDKHDDSFIDFKVT